MRKRGRDEFCDDKNTVDPLCLFFFAPFLFHHARGTREKLRLSALSDLCSSYVHEMPLHTRRCTHVHPLDAFYARPAASRPVVPSSRKWKWNFASILYGNNACRPRDIPRSDLIWRRNKPDWHAAICSACRMNREMKLLNLRLRRVLFAVLIRSTSESPRLNHCRRVRLLNSGNTHSSPFTPPSRGRLRYCVSRSR